MTNDNCNGQAISEVCRTTVGERPRYFPRQLITPEDMTMEQDYFRNRMRMHNRLLHGWGVVCGALVGPVPTTNGNGGIEPWKVRVCPGYALGPYGDEIIIACEHEIDLRQSGVTGTAADPCGMSRDPWCSEVWMERDPSAKYYVAVKYKEMAVRPLRVQPVGCGCDESRCEFSRLRDGYEIRVLTETEYAQIRAASETPPAWDELFMAPNTRNPACWPCPPQPWVVLACIELDENGRPILIDNCTPRRLVAALAGFHWKCAEGVKINSVAPATFRRGQTNVTLVVTGEGFQEGLKVLLGKGISVIKNSFARTPAWPNEFSVKVNVAADADPGERDVVVINPDCSFARAERILTVNETTRASALTEGEEISRPPQKGEAPAEESKVAEARPRRRRSPEA